MFQTSRLPLVLSHRHCKPVRLQFLSRCSYSNVFFPVSTASAEDGIQVSPPGLGDDGGSTESSTNIPSPIDSHTVSTDEESFTTLVSRPVPGCYTEPVSHGHC